jgi:hypothetical protein
MGIDGDDGVEIVDIIEATLRDSRTLQNSLNPEDIPADNGVYPFNGELIILNDGE